MRYPLSIFMAAGMFLAPLSAQGQNPAKAEAQIQTIRIVLHPMPEPSPALKYQLLPPLIDRRPGNAAVEYNKIPAERTAFFSNSEMWDKLIAYINAPLTELRQKDVRSLINSYPGTIDDLIRAGRCNYCDWQLPIREQEFWAILLPEVQQIRSYARLLAAKARLQIAEGKYDEAVATLQAGYALARHVSRGQSLVHCLIGTAITDMMGQQLRELIQQPDAPNLYWALTDLPRPIVDYRTGMEGVHDAFYLSFPELQNLDKKELAPDQWRILLTQTIQKMLRVGSRSFNPDLASPFAALILMEKYPQAKTFLISRGWPADKVEAMPVCQVALLASLRQYEEIRDNLFKWINLPYSECYAGIKKTDAELSGLLRSGQEIFPLASLLLPEIGTAKKPEVRGERLIAALRILEALRLYAAAHQGCLPERLSDITEVPVPLDPVQGAPFIYHCDGNKAILESPAPPGSNIEAYWLRYEITMQSKGK